MKKRYVIAGGSAAGMAAAHTLRKMDPEARITVLSDETDPPYFRPMIPYIVNRKKKAAEIGLAGCGIFTGQDLDICLNQRVAAVDFRGKTVTTESGKVFSYDKVLMATGSRPYLPPALENPDTPGVYALKTLAQARDMAERAESATHAVMLGGGILNLKAAFALLERGVNVTLVVQSPQVLSQLMAPEDAQLIRQALDRAGLAILTGCSAVAVIRGTEGVAGVALDNGRELGCEMVCIGKGVEPNVDFLADGAVQMDRGVVTDPYTAASAPDTFAAGDVAVTHDPATGERTMTALWTNAVEMGICAGRNMAGVKTRCAGTLGIMNATQVADLPFVAMGCVHTAGKAVEVHTCRQGDRLRKVVFDQGGGRLLGALFVGDITHAGLYRYLIREKRPVRDIKTHLINQTLHYGHLMARKRGAQSRVSG